MKSIRIDVADDGTPTVFCDGVELKELLVLKLEIDKGGLLDGRFFFRAGDAGRKEGESVLHKPHLQSLLVQVMEKTPDFIPILDESCRGPE